MSRTVTELLNAALALPEDERAELVELLSDSLPPPPNSLHPAWKDEIRRRAAEVDSGLVKPIPWEQVRREAEAQLELDQRTSRLSDQRDTRDGAPGGMSRRDQCPAGPN